MSREFNNNIGFIMHYVYGLLEESEQKAPQSTPDSSRLIQKQTDKEESSRLKKKHQNLAVESRELCKKYTGPH